MAARLKRESPEATVALPVDGSFSIASALVGRMGEIMGRPIACPMGGDTVRILDALLETGTPALVCPHETDQVAFVNKVLDRLNILVRFNLHSGIVAHETWDELRAEADRALAFARGRPHTVLGAGVLPYETTPEPIFRLRGYLALHHRQTRKRKRKTDCNEEPPLLPHWHGTDAGHQRPGG